MTKSSRDKVEKYMLPIAEVEEVDDTMNVKEAQENGDWLFIFKAARETHLYQGVVDDPVLVYERQEQEKEYLSKMKHVAGDFNRWITRFEDHVETCETVGVAMSDEAKIHYFMNNLNDTIFGIEFYELEHDIPVPEELRGLKAENHRRV